VGLLSVVTVTARPAAADSFVPVSGAGSTWSQNALDQWRRDVQQYGMRVNYQGTGSSDGRRQFLNGTVDFAASDIPFQFHPEDNSTPENPAPGSYAYMPVTAGGTVFMYNLTINGPHQDLHWGDHQLERSGYCCGQPAASTSKQEGRAGRPLGRIGLDCPVHQVDDQPARRYLEPVLPKVGSGAGVRNDLVLPDGTRNDRPSR
jgi:hypothetical protein